MPSSAVRRLACFASLTVATTVGAAPPPPPARAAAHVVSDTYFGTVVDDPYRWMETPGSPDLATYLKAQNDYFQALLAPLAPKRAAMLARITQLQRGTTQTRRYLTVGGSDFYMVATPDSKDYRLALRPRGGAERIIFDPASVAGAGQHAAMDYYAPSPDGKRVAIGVALGGSENDTIRVLDVANGTLLPDTITRAQYSFPAWLPGSNSFLYARLQQTAANDPSAKLYENQRIYLHVLGRDPSQDPAVFGPGVVAGVDLPAAGFVAANVSPAAPWVIASATAGTIDTGVAYVAPASAVNGPATPWRKLYDRADEILSNDLHGDIFYAITKRGTNNGKVLAYDLRRAGAAPTVVYAPTDLVMTTFDAFLVAAGDALYVGGSLRGRSRLMRIPYETQAAETVPLPAEGTVSDVAADSRAPGFGYLLDSWTRSPRFYRFDPATKQSSDTGIQPADPADSSDIVADEVETTSADGTSIPVSIVHRRGIALDGSHPTIVEAYGCYGYSSSSFFSATRLAWYERGAVYAVAHVRGGGELGEAWHVAGQRANKQHTIDDLIAAARYLIDKRYTSPAHLAPRGTSCGGIAVGGAIVQHPELFGAALDRVGISDLLRFETSAGGAANVPELGTVKNPADFRAMLAVSPYHHVTPLAIYPAVMLETGVNDPRVPSWQLAKMTARLQAATASSRPIALRVDFDAGHGIGSDRTQAAALAADENTFLLWQLGDPAFQP